MGSSQLIRRYVQLSVAGGILIGILLVPVIDAATRNNNLQQPVVVDGASSKLPEQQIPEFAALQTPRIITAATATLSDIADEQDSRSCAEVACLALTFDDGPDGVATPALLDVLKRHKARATFFVLGNRVIANPEITRRIYREGHDVGNHSWSHPNLSTLSDDEAEQQVNNTQNVIRTLGLPEPHLFRPPYGINTPGLSSRLRLSTILWNVDPKDWHQTDANKLAHMMVGQARPGGIMVMHDIEPVTAAAAERALTELKKHYRLVTVSKLLELTPGSRGIYFGR